VVCSSSGPRAPRRGWLWRATGNHIHSERSWFGPAGSATTISWLERKAVPGADALVADFEKITLKTTSTFRRAKGGRVRMFSPAP
jgi:hypothetical protein